MITVYLDRLGVISGEQKRTLEAYADPNVFTQRKNYDEYYITCKHMEAEFSVNDLMLLAKSFEVVVGPEFVMLLDV